MEVKKLYWWKHSCPSGNYSSAKVHRGVDIKLKEGVVLPKTYDDFDVEYTPLEGLECEIFEG